ncbi:MAG TPA: TetR-like C-terminal domain-containing protein [Xanthobacteraceae bacterium]|nr:TetR-like C-terminal domain-containing protein [Xanthobacteraceae bacterium]
MTKAAERRQRLKDALISAAERTIESHGLSGLKARALAFQVGCAVGAIYNVVTDLDDLIFAVNSRTLAALERDLAAAEQVSEAAEKAAPVDRLVRLGTAYLAFAIAHRVRWRALFEHRLPAGKHLPGQFLEDQRRLFRYVEEPLGELQPHLSDERRALVARSLFSAVHGVVMLGLEEKLQTVPFEILREQVGFIVSTLGRGMLAQAGDSKESSQSSSVRKRAP